MPTPAPHHAHRESFGQLIAARRRHLGLSQRDLADELCAATGRPTITRNDLSRYERGTRLPRRPILVALAECLDLPIGDLRRQAVQHRESRAGGNNP